MNTRPETSEYASFYADYVRRVPDGDVCDALEKQLLEYLQVFSHVSDQAASTPRKDQEWTLKEVLGHLGEAERIFGYRALRIARGDTTPLAGFEQDDYIRAAHYNERALSDLLAEFEHLRRANLSMFRSFSAEEAKRLGTASNATVSARALIYVTAGHAQRHLEILRERFGL